MKIYNFETLDSTNEFLKTNYIKYNEFDVIRAKIQTKGKARHGNVWFSNEGMAMFTFFVRKHDNLTDSDYLKLPILAGLATIKGLTSFENLNYKLKWTNDIYLKDNKLAGILVEKIEDIFFIGIGINVNNNIPDEIKNIAVSLNKITNKTYDITKIISSIVREFQEIYNSFSTDLSYWESILKEINKLNYLKNRQITLTTSNNRINGIAQNINEKGELEILSNNKLYSFSTGEVLKNRLLIPFDFEKNNFEYILKQKKLGNDIIVVLFITEKTTQNNIDFFENFIKVNRFKGEKIYLKSKNERTTLLESLSKKYNVISTKKI